MKKILALMLALILAATCFVIGSAEEEPYVVTVISTFYTEDEPMKDELNHITSYVEEALNVDFQITWVRGPCTALRKNYRTAVF